MEFKSEYYKSFPDYMVENNISPEDAAIIAPAIQGPEEMDFAFAMFLIM
ncbi:MAG: hypothetical protein ACOWWH_04920 [Eubacteriaceae bacterium]